MTTNKMELAKGIDEAIRLLRSARNRLVNGSNVVDLETGPNFQLRCSIHYKLGKIHDIEYLETLGRVIEAFLSELEEENHQEL